MTPSGEYIPFSHGQGGAHGHEGSFVPGIQRTLDLASWEEVWGNSTTGIQTVKFLTNS